MSSADRPVETNRRGHLRPVDLGWVGAGIGLAATLGILLIRSANGSGAGEGSSVVSTAGLTVMFAGPAIVGAIGAANRRREVLVGAGLAYLPMAVLAFSGVTMILLIPALLFAYAGLRDPDRLGQIGRRRDQPIVAVAVTGLLIAGLVGLFATTTAICWERSVDGTVTEREATASDASGVEIPVGTGDVVASGCSSGVLSTTGLAIVLACTAASAGLAVRFGRARG